MFELLSGCVMILRLEKGGLLGTRSDELRITNRFHGCVGTMVSLSLSGTQKLVDA